VDGHGEQKLHAARWQEGIHRRRSMMDDDFMDGEYEFPGGNVEFVRLYFDKDYNEFRAKDVGTFDVGDTEESFLEAWEKHIDPLLTADLRADIFSQFVRKDQLEELYFDLCGFFYIDEEEDK
jgi:hypothetical protein